MTAGKSYSVRFRKDGSTLIDAVQARKALILMLYDRRYLVEELPGKLFFSRIENFYVKFWPKTLVEISETEDCLVFTFSISSFRSFFLFPHVEEALKYHIDKEALPEWKFLRA
ncbi:MAG TPA: hypothetical protein VFJ43_02660 [Bacteroidia bacterium]|nr:hypothetical protein [Bacteroidia bacterium]